MANTSDPWIKASDVLPMFPTLVWKIQLRPQFHQPLNAQVLELLGTMRQDLPQLAPGEGWQSVQTLHQLAQLQELSACVTRVARSVLRFLSIGYDAVEITACWATVLAPGASHRAHGHPNNFLSGVYYVQTNPGGDTINFHDPRVQTGIIRPPVVALTAENTDQVLVKIGNGALLMFPAYLQHSVDTNTSGQERVSISFNLMFSSFTESLSKPLW